MEIMIWVSVVIGKQLYMDAGVIYIVFLDKTVCGSVVVLSILIIKLPTQIQKVDGTQGIASCGKQPGFQLLNIHGGGGIINSFIC